MWLLENCVGSESKLFKHDSDNSSILYLPCSCVTTFPENAIIFTAFPQYRTVHFFRSTVTQRVVLEAANHLSLYKYIQWKTMSGPAKTYPVGMALMSSESYIPAISNFLSFVQGCL